MRMGLGIAAECLDGHTCGTLRRVYFLTLASCLAARGQLLGSLARSRYHSICWYAQKYYMNERNIQSIAKQQNSCGQRELYCREYRQFYGPENHYTDPAL